MKKFILMDPDELKRLKTSKEINSDEYKIVNPRLNAMARLNKTIEERLVDDSTSDDEKAKSFIQAFNDFLLFKNQYLNQTAYTGQLKQPSIESSDMKGISANEIGKTVPKNLRSKAERLAELLKESGKIAWDKQNRLIINGQPVEGTNIIDLINDALRRRKTFVPRGRHIFAAQLRDLNAPRELVGNVDYWDESGESSSHDGDYVSPLKTPQKPRRRPVASGSSSRKQSVKTRRRADWTKNRPSIEEIKWSRDINM